MTGSLLPALALAAALGAGGAAEPGGAVPVRAPPPLPAPPRTVAPARAVEQRLANGLRVVVVEHHRRPVAIVRLHLPSGAATERPRLGGATWLAVHLVTDFRELDDRGERLAGEKSFRHQVAELGGAADAEVGADQTLLEISGYAADAGLYLDHLAAAVLHPRRGAESFRSRRSALLDFLEDLQATDPEALQRMISEASFGAGHPYARSAIGTLETLTPLGLEDVVARQDEVLSPRGATLVVVGDVRAAEVFSRARRAFGAWQRDPAPGVGRLPADPPAARAEVGLLRREPASTLLVCATRPLPDVRGQDPALDVLAALLGDGTGSRLNARLRETTGLSYHAGATVVRHRLARAFRACARVAADRGAEGVRTIRAVLDGLRTSPPGDDEVRRARARCLASLDEADDTAAGIAAAWTEALARGEAWPRPAEERAALEQVGPAEVQRLARTVLDPRTLSWILSGERRAATQAAAGGRLGPVVPFKLGR